MAYRLTKIYTRTGDDGNTGPKDRRISKGDLLIEALGTVDELNAWIGFVLSCSVKNTTMANALVLVQHQLFDLGGELYMPEHVAITAEKVTGLEQQLDALNEQLPPLTDFLLPGGGTMAAALHVCRTVCRRAERCVVRLNEQSRLSNPEILRYLNRLSDLFFVMARALGQKAQEKEMVWQHDKHKP